MMSRERLSLQLLNSFMLNLPFMLGGALAAPQVLLPRRTGLVLIPRLTVLEKKL